MELDDFKKIVNTSNRGSHQVLSGEELVEIGHRRSKHPVVRIRRKLIIEWLGSLLLALALVVLYIAGENLLHPWAFWSLLGIFIVYISYGVYSIARLPRNFQFSDNSQAFIETFLLRIITYKRILIKSVLVTIPLGYTIGYCSGIYFARSEEFLKVLLNTRSVLIFLAAGLITLALGFYLNRWIYGKIYDKHIHELEEILSEMKGEGGFGQSEPVSENDVTSITDR